MDGAEGLLSGSIVVDPPDPAVVGGEDHEDLTVKERDLPEARACDTDDHAVACRMELEPLDAALTAGERLLYPVQDRFSPLADKFGADALMHDIRVKAGGNGVDIAPASGVEVVENGLHRQVTHRLLLQGVRLLGVD